MALSQVEGKRMVKGKKFNHPDHGWVVTDGGLENAENVASLSSEEHYSRASKAFNAGNWEESAKQFNIVVCNYPNTPCGQDAQFFLGLSYYYLCEFDIANDILNSYLACQTNPKYFKEAIEYKFCIAEQFRGGARRRFFGVKKMPKWASGKGMALEIYEEVIAAIPSHDTAARAYFAKGCLLWQQKDYDESIEAFTCVIKRYPKHELAPESFMLINKIYLQKCQCEFQNPDILAFSEMNLSKFEEQFPREERLETARADVLMIKEVYAKGLYDTGHFYERVSQPRAAVIYYQKAMFDFPETTIAECCRRRLRRLCPSALEIPNNVKEKVSLPEEIEFPGFLEEDDEVSA